MIWITDIQIMYNQLKNWDLNVCYLDHQSFNYDIVLIEIKLLFYIYKIWIADILNRGFVPMTQILDMSVAQIPPVIFYT